MEPDYSNYELKELLEARASIDRDAHIYRYFKICQEIDAKIVKPEEIKTLTRRDNFAKLAFVKVIFSLLTIFLTHKLFVAFTEGYISWKGKTNYYVQQSPQNYYVLIAIHLFFLLFLLYLLVTKHWADKLNN